MKRRSPWLAFAACAFLSGVTHPTHAGEVKNGDFSSGVVAPWKVEIRGINDAHPKESGRVKVVQGEGIATDKALQIVLDPSSRVEISQEIRVPQNSLSSYEISFRVKTSADFAPLENADFPLGVGISAGIVRKKLPRVGSQLAGSTTSLKLEPGTGWKLMAVKKSTDTSWRSFDISFTLPRGTGKVFLDDISLR